ncbi:alcohol dehydrogenase Bli-4 [Fusarium beomiforme]|uniref:Alcohol dehydrogenase Bli-4 n=1 Tax=Fusarium beomiforme TaxID=44412 RepID=A0A9P5AEI3_9HYPO|nr:alcohol dehydrogenase Bli-4 [Fusarium beomiforme]
MFWTGQQDFDPKDIPSLQGKVILVTGATAGLGKESVLQFAYHNPQRIYLCGRNLQKAQIAAQDIKQKVPSASIRLLQLDLFSFASVREAAQIVLSECKRLDILMLNAGTMFVPPGRTPDGYEIQFGTNHMGHAFLTKLLIPLLDKTARIPGADVRIVCLASHGHVYLKKGGFDFDTLKTNGESIGLYQCYYQSKLGNILWVRQLAKKHPHFTVSAIDPGLVQTELLNKATGLAWYLYPLVRCMLITPVAKGVRNQLWASVAPGVVSGEYYEPIGKHGLATEDGKDEKLAETLWQWTERELAVSLK